MSSTVPYLRQQTVGKTTSWQKLALLFRENSVLQERERHRETHREGETASIHWRLLGLMRISATPDAIIRGKTDTCTALRDYYCMRGGLAKRRRPIPSVTKAK